MRDGAPHIGTRLREARLRRQLTLAGLAEQTDLTKGFLSLVERDLTSPSVGTLLRICRTLEIPVGDLFSTTQGPLVRAGERARVEFGGEGVEEVQLTPAGEEPPARPALGHRPGRRQRRRAVRARRGSGVRPRAGRASSTWTSARRATASPPATR
jgi:transcriptional regulator with XRE-family HTH domain